MAIASVPLAPQRKSIFLMGEGPGGGGGAWLSWTTLVHVIRGFDPEDPTGRIYFSGSGSPKWTDNTMVLPAPAPNATRELAVPAPTSPPTLTITTDGAGSAETRYYLTTIANDLGWESAPSPFTKIACNGGAIIEASSFEAPPAGNYGITKRRLYRTATSQEGASDFQLVSEAPIGQATIEDDAGELGEVLVTQGEGILGAWVPPPDNLTWLTTLWNGMAAAIVGKSVRFSVAGGRLYAWPLSFEILLGFTPQALATWQQNLLVLTTSTPSIITGQDPASMSEQPLDSLPFVGSCVSPASAVSLPQGAAWATPDGLAYVGTTGARVLTMGLLTPDDWLAINPPSLVGCQWRGLYVGFYNAGAGWKGFLIDPLNPTGMYWLDVGFPAAYHDPYTGALFVLDGGSIKKWDAGAAFMTAKFVSKVFTTPSTNFGYLRVMGNAWPVTVRLFSEDTEAEEDPDRMDVPMVERAVVVVEDGGVVGLPDGYESRLWQIHVEAIKPVLTVLLGESPEEIS
ncbi:MAG: hypothetical protein WAQ08_16145 [Aquabacterium sp.]|uniref:hypothetical protein n=1 Tax=Aquabacterium sp. TaxID=1872578 RepID=UPI003BAEF9FC